MNGLDLWIVAAGLAALPWILAADAPAPSKRSPEGIIEILCDPKDFPPLPPPEPGDWRAAFPEKPQSFEAYIRSKPIRADAKRTKISIQLVGAIDAESEKLLARAREYAEAFFACPVAMEKPIALPDRGYRERDGWGRRWRQYHTGLFLDELLPPTVGEDEICVIGVTLADLYPDESWNFVFGQASLRNRIGIYSLARYFPSFYGEKTQDRSSPIILRRVLKVFVHESCHMFGMQHCQDHACLLNGSNSLGEADRRPIHLCGPCLRKLAWNRGFDPVDRYRKIETFFRAQKISDEADWIAGRLKKAAAAK